MSCPINRRFLDDLYAGGRLLATERDAILCGTNPAVFRLSAYDLYVLTYGRLGYANAGVMAGARRAAAAGRPPRVVSIPGSASSALLLDANDGRTGFSVKNDSAGILLLKYGALASATDYSLDVQPGALWVDPFQYTGRVDGIWTLADGFGRITELS